MTKVKRTLMFLVFLLLGVFWGNSVLFAQCPMVCRQNFNVSLGSDGTATLTPDIVLNTSTEGCTEGFTINIIDANSGYQYGSVATAQMIGVTLMFNVIDNATGNNCDGNISVLDNTPPQLFLDTLYLDCNADFNPNAFGLPVAVDNVTPYEQLTFDWVDEYTDLECFSDVNGHPVTGQLERTWTVSDASGNTRQGSQLIYRKRNAITDVVFPANRDDISAPALICNVSNALDLSLTGEPMINGIPVSQGDCDLIVSHVDQETPVCGGETKIFRSWTVFDYCTDESETIIQLIRLKDKIAPELNCPSAFEVGTAAGQCTATVNIPNATATDNCSDYYITHSWEYGDSDTTYYNIPVGTHYITFTAKDECNNQSACQTAVTVYDDEEPTPVCKENTFVALGVNGSGILGAHLFNESSSDNCQIDRFEVSRNGTDFFPALTFNCTDIEASPITLTMRVYDVAGHHNECEVTVTLEDNLIPTITCPDNVTLDCEQDYSNLYISGIAEVMDNCIVDTLYYNDNENGLNNCGFGTVFRLWTVADLEGNFATCTQEINIGDSTITSVEFPADFTTTDCSMILNPEATGMPIISGQDCEQIQIYHNDDTIAVSDACLHIVREWNVFDDCVFNPNNAAGTGHWSYNQTLKIYDNIAPDLQAPPDITMFINGEENCEIYVHFPDATATDCSTAISVSNNSFYADDNGVNASGTYPRGFHQITFTARDKCDNIINQTVQLTVLDAKVPTAQCTGGFTINLGNDGAVTPDPQLFDAGSFDDCSTDLIYVITPSTFTCEHRGQTEVLFQVRDEDGNEASCFTTVNVQDNNNACEAARLAGKVTNEEGETIGGKYIGLGGTVQMAMPTNLDGTYEFSGLPSGEYYTITPTYNLNPVNGVTTGDIVKIRKHILVAEKFTSPYTLIAADVNGSGSVTTMDIVWIRKLILGIITEYPNNIPSWRFVPNSHEFTDPENPFADNFPEEIFIQTLNQNYLNNDFTAIKIGDVNGSANVSNITGDSSEERDGEERDKISLLIEDKKVEAGYTYKVPLKAKDFTEIIGMQASLFFDKDVLDFQDIIIEELAEMKPTNFGLTNVNEGLINWSWDTHYPIDLEEDTNLFTLVFIAKKEANLKEILKINTSFLQAEAYRENRHGFEVIDIELSFKNNTEKTGIELYQNSPNPVSSETQIAFYISKASEAKLSILDVHGNIIWQHQDQYSVGKHQVDIDFSEIKAIQGVLFYRLQADGFRTQTRKMIYTPL